MEPDLSASSKKKKDGSDSPPREESPLKIADNIRDLDIDFNSADDVRQAMKAVMNGTVQSNYNEDDDTTIHNRPKLVNPLDHKTVQITDKLFPKRHAAMSGRRRSGQGIIRKKKSRQEYIDYVYLGKLSNVVSFKKKRPLDATTDADSDISSMLKP